MNTLNLEKRLNGKVSKDLSDEKLFELCRKYGERARFWRQKFIGLLPEVFKRKLYEKKGFSSIFEFAAKLAGISAEQVRLTLNLEKRFEDKPSLRNLLINGEASINKLTRVVSIATTENEEELAEKVLLLPQKALEVLVRDEKIANREIVEISGMNDSGNNNFHRSNAKKENGFVQSLFGDEGLRTQTLESSELVKKRTLLNVELSADVVGKLNELQAKGIDVNEFLRMALESREAEIAAAKKEISESIEPTNSRYISVKIKKILRNEFGDKCSIKHCKKAAKQIHHTQRFSLAHTHDPHYLAPLCVEHHVIAHAVDVRVWRVRRI